MKVLIWIGCLFVASLIIVSLRYAGVLLGGIPTALLYAATLWAARTLCQKYDEKHSSSDTTNAQEQ